MRVAVAAAVLSLSLAACGSAAPLAPSLPATVQPTSASLAPITDSPTNATSPTPTRAAELLSIRPVGFGGSPLGYLEYLPPDFGTGNQKPLLVYLHSSGEIGDGSLQDLDLLTKIGIPKLIKDGDWPAERPFVVLMPQYRDRECTLSEETDSFLNWAVSEYAADPEQIFLTGVSCGAIGIWDYLGEHGDEVVSAAVPIGGHLEDAWPSARCDLGRVPVWAFHGEEDEIVPLAGVGDRIEELGECSSAPEIRFTVLPGANHAESLSLPYELSTGDDIYSWLLQH